MSLYLVIKETLTHYILYTILHVGSLHRNLTRLYGQSRIRLEHFGDAIQSCRGGSKLQDFADSESLSNAG